jgi:glucose-1-phosphatase
MASTSLVAFDLDGVLYDFHPARRLACIAELSGKDPAWIKATIWDSDFERSAEAGAFATGEAYLQAFNRLLGFALTREQWVMARRLAMSPRPEMLALLKALQPRVQLAVLTNNGMLLRETLPDLAPELHALLGDHMHVTAAFGVRKPDPLVYTRLVERYGCAPSAALFIDDDQGNVDGARKAGLGGLLFRGVEEVGLALREMLA